MATRASSRQRTGGAANADVIREAVSAGFEDVRASMDSLSESMGGIVDEMRKSRSGTSRSTNRAIRDMRNDLSAPLRDMLKLMEEQAKADRRPEPEPEPERQRPPPQQDPQQRRFLDRFKGISDSLDEVVDKLDDVGSNLKNFLINSAVTVGSIAALQKSLKDTVEYSKAGMVKGFSSGESLTSRMKSDFTTGQDERIIRVEKGDFKVDYQAEQSGVFGKLMSRTTSSHIEELAIKYGKDSDEMRAAAQSLLKNNMVQQRHLKANMEEIAGIATASGRSVEEVAQEYADNYEKFGKTAEQTRKELLESLELQDKLVRSTNMPVADFNEGLQSVSEELEGQTTDLMKQRKLYAGMVQTFSKMGYHSSKAAKYAAEVTKNMLSVDDKDEGLRIATAQKILDQQLAHFEKMGATTQEQIQAAIEKKMMEDSANIDPMTGKLTQEAKDAAKKNATYISAYRSDKGIAATQSANILRAADMAGAGAATGLGEGENGTRLLARELDKWSEAARNSGQYGVVADLAKQFGFEGEAINEWLLSGKKLEDFFVQAEAGLAEATKAAEADREANGEKPLTGGPEQLLEEAKNKAMEQGLYNALAAPLDTLQKILECVSGIPALSAAILGFIALRKGATLVKGAQALKTAAKAAITGRSPEVIARAQRMADAARAAQGPSLASRALSTTGKVVSKAALPLTIAASGFTGYEQKQAELANNTTLTEEQKKTQALSTGIGAGAGAGVGMWGGAMAGAAIGSVVPVVGTAIGGLIGGAVGAWLGEKGGSMVGEAVGEAMTTSDAEAYEKNRQRLTTEQRANSSPIGMLPIAKTGTAGPANISGEGIVSPLNGDLIIKNAGVALMQFMQAQQAQQTTPLYGHKR